MNGEKWSRCTVAPDATHHLRDGSPAYRARFDHVLAFHSPGLAPASDDTGAFHINTDGMPAYPQRYLRAFGFYEGRAAVRTADGWHHILADGDVLYQTRYAWCGNFQGGRCAVRQQSGRYLHIDADGAPAYTGRYKYVGDFREGCAVVQRDDGLHSHMDASGGLVHGVWFEDLDVFHKGHARAADRAGWHHVNKRGEPLYRTRFKAVEPFYNGQARTVRSDGSLCVIDECGAELLELRSPTRSPLEVLSADMVGAWRTQTIRAAVELGVFERLPAGARVVETVTGLAPGMGIRLMRALQELGLVRQDEDGLYRATERGAHLTGAHPLSLAAAARMWGDEHYSAWADIKESLRSGESAFEKTHGENLFDWLAQRPALHSWHRAFAAYAKHDYRDLPEQLNLDAHKTLLDAGAGRGDLALTLLRAYPGLRGVAMDRPEVVAGHSPPPDVADRCRFVAGDLFAEWPVTADAVFLARVLHDWPDRAAVRILQRARDALEPSGLLYIVEMILDESTGAGGLLDLNLLAMTGGGERTEPQYERLLGAADFRLRRLVPTRSVNSVIVAAPA